MTFYKIGFLRPVLRMQLTNLMYYVCGLQCIYQYTLMTEKNNGLEHMEAIKDAFGTYVLQLYSFTS